MTFADRLDLAATMATMFLAIGTALLVAVTWRTAIAAERNAKLAAREYSLLRRPMAIVKWGHAPSRNDLSLYLSGEVTEVAGVRTRLHSLIAKAKPSTSGPVETVSEPGAMLYGDFATYPFLLSWIEPQDWLVDAAEIPRNADFVVAQIEIRLVISVADPEATQETWLLTGMLTYDPRQERYVMPTMTAECVSEREPVARRSRIVDPVRRAWNRWWDSVC
ncbi:MAG: hypothetical protein OXH69_19400 [Acidobacteria bacterium]|nr:hypothetical protein [Acidobacteriota bacterium]